MQLFPGPYSADSGLTDLTRYLPPTVKRDGPVTECWDPWVGLLLRQHLLGGLSLTPLRRLISANNLSFSLCVLVTPISRVSMCFYAIYSHSVVMHRQKPFQTGDKSRHLPCLLVLGERKCRSEFRIYCLFQLLIGK